MKIVFFFSFIVLLSCSSNEMKERNKMNGTRGTINVSSEKDESKDSWANVVKAILTKKYLNIDTFLSQDIKNRKIDGLNIEKFIIKNWINDEDFLISLKTKKYKINVQDSTHFFIQIDIDYPKEQNEDWEGKVVWFIKFYKLDGRYKIYDISRAG